MAQMTCSFLSYTLCRSVEISVVIPTPVFSEAIPDDPGAKPKSHTPRAPYPVLYLLHGYSNDYTTWLRYTSAERYAEEHNMALVTFSTENKAYSNYPETDRFYDFVQRELPDFVTGLFPVSGEARHTYIAGLSMGGFGTLLHALHNPERFRAFGSFSAGLSHSGVVAEPDAESFGKRLDLFLALDRLGGNIKSMPAGYLSCGTDDKLFAVNEEFKEKYLALGGSLTWKAAPGFGHEWRFWDEELKNFLNWIPRDDFYAGTLRRA